MVLSQNFYHISDEDSSKYKKDKNPIFEKIGNTPAWYVLAAPMTLGTILYSCIKYLHSFE